MISTTIDAELVAFERAILAGDPHPELAVRLVDLRKALQPDAALEDLWPVQNALSKTPWLLFCALHERLGETVFYEEIVAKVWPRRRPGNPSMSIRTTANRMRARIARLPWHLENVFGEGYRLHRLPAPDARPLR